MCCNISPRILASVAQRVCDETLKHDLTGIPEMCKAIMFPKLPRCLIHFGSKCDFKKTSVTASHPLQSQELMCRLIDRSITTPNGSDVFFLYAFANFLLPLQIQIQDTLCKSMKIFY